MSGRVVHPPHVFARLIAKSARLLENNAAFNLINQLRKEDPMAASGKLLVTLEDGIKRITINRPERRNSVDTETVGLLHEEIQRSAEDESRVIILTGAGDSFCAGADLQASSESDIRDIDVT